MTRKIVKNRYLNNDLQIDVDRPFPIKVNYSNVQHHGKSMSSPLYLNDLIKLRSQLPAQKGVYTTQGLTLRWRLPTLRRQLVLNTSSGWTESD